MKINWNKKYTTYAIYAALICAAIIFCIFVGIYMKYIWSGILFVLNVFAPLFYGCIIAYILTPLMRIFEPTGMELSIGQWQKLAIARAFYSDSDILILDEPTASLDPIAEQEIYNQFDMLRENKTTVFVSHRLSSATVADQIIVLENGQVVENGNHRELMDLKGKYHKLFSTQAKRYISEK